MDVVPKLPIGEWMEGFVEVLGQYKGVLFDPVSIVISTMVTYCSTVLAEIPSLILILLLGAAAWVFAGRASMVFTVVGLSLIHNLGYWDETMETLGLVLTATMISIAIGIPVGILCARYDTFRNLVTPILDLMQTMPAFVYLIPAIFFFGLGEVPGVIASVIFALPPIVRLTNLGIRQVPAEMEEAADAFGATGWQKLVKVQLPYAKSTILAGVNQCIMLALSMVVIAAMIGAKGLGADVYRAVSQVDIGRGFEAGLSIVIIAIVLDRLTQHAGKKERNI
ncbi:proline/glycine betaine ABC transporter permease [Brevibacillus sp. HB1.2]|uniref:Glycine/betaine ABC transporter n=1 Tax=Brevibacillus porteri TaxID=2126350 RepID=A0ABX5FQV7_9BACL|nr:MULTISPECIES: proline/glycine betaine ABC transporter permease [Brevibacillus]MDC0764536.1 proline/glycine betaine ABC transporter permease [Brevibacillus sp. AG]MED1797009.1 proline/glycine betaine ABC transporter permease [Brevibacillus porteri]MED2129762.1 proline/glycine betaine ABC transporter permease [Brevibacillus porteri]MED2744721.1 proline/glycine betaine ABC transporter permease [Brevibacillus porteri]MED2814514.1 proline/glycine betaine ABC transporter permease [Brevibacillus p